MPRPQVLGRVSHWPLAPSRGSDGSAERDHRTPGARIVIR